MSLSFSSALSVSGDRAGFEVSSVGLPSVTARSFSFGIRGPCGSEACGAAAVLSGPAGRMEDQPAGSATRAAAALARGARRTRAALAVRTVVAGRTGVRVLRRTRSAVVLGLVRVSGNDLVAWL